MREEVTRRHRSWRTVAGLVATLAVHAWAVWQVLAAPAVDLRAAPRAKAPETLPPVAALASTDALPKLSSDHQVHAASLCELEDGRLFAVWYEGSREGAEDVSICGATWEQVNGWRQPSTLISRDWLIGGSARYVKRLGNPVVTIAPDGRLWLLFVTTSIGGWSTSSIQVCWSDDDGDTWSFPQRLILSPFLNLSHLVRNPPVWLADGCLAVPIYHEFVGKFPELLIIEPLAKGVRVIAKQRLAGGRRYLQPALAALPTGEWLAYSRAADVGNPIAWQQSLDQGRQWTSPASLPFQNPDAAICAVTLADGRLLLAFNDDPRHRRRLAVSSSRDGHSGWTTPWIPGDEEEKASYPTMLQSADGTIHFVYTSDRRELIHRWFQPDQLAPADREAD